MKEIDATIAEKLFTAYELHGLAQLLSVCQTKNITEIGSSSFAPRYANDLRDIIEITFNTFGIYPKGLTAMYTLRNAGDTSGMYYFGGLKIDPSISSDQAPTVLSATAHLCYLAALLETLEAQCKQSLRTLDHLAGTLAAPMLKT